MDLFFLPGPVNRKRASRHPGTLRAWEELLVRVPVLVRVLYLWINFFFRNIDGRKFIRNQEQEPGALARYRVGYWVLGDTGRIDVPACITFRPCARADAVEFRLWLPITPDGRDHFAAG